MRFKLVLTKLNRFNVYTSAQKNIVELLIIYFLLYLKSELAFTEKIKYVIIIILQNKK